MGHNRETESEDADGLGLANGDHFEDFDEDFTIQKLPTREQRQFGKDRKNTIQSNGNAKQPSSSRSRRRSARELNPMEPPESSLLHDLPFLLQGLSTTNFKFQGSSLTIPPTLPVPVVSLMHTLAEPCLLYRSLTSWMQTAEGGLIGQSLRAAIGTELRSYLALVTTLEGEIRRDVAMLDDAAVTDGRKARVTLKRCVIWTREATLGLRLMSAMMEASKGALGNIASDFLVLTVFKGKRAVN